MYGPSFRDLAVNPEFEPAVVPPTEFSPMLLYFYRSIGWNGIPFELSVSTQFYTAQRDTL